MRARLVLGDEGATATYASAGLKSRKLTVGATDAYLLWTDAVVIVAFRGTQSDQWEDVLTDIAIAPVPWRVGRAHSGFVRAVLGFWPTLTAAADPLAGGRAVWFTGHSLGAAPATLAADKYPGTRGVCTFGSPRVGNPAFADDLTGRFSGRMLRYVNHNDVVTHVPVPPLYEHIALPRYIARDGTVSSKPPDVLHFFSDLIGHPQQLAPLMGGAAVPGSFTPTFLLDHMPKAYAVWTWNDCDRQP